MPPITPETRHLFREDLIAWYRRHRRVMPWRDHPDPYHVWISEIMLQQTRVDQATPYFLRFVEAFPTVEALAAAPLDAVLVRWEGLGYYARARNLHRAAQQVVAEHGGRVPDAYDAFRALPGVGPYTAAAVQSIAFGHPHAVLDGNVIRVLTRVFALPDDVSRPATKRALQRLADDLLAPESPGDFNQAVMELGARVCTPRTPDCPACPLRNGCQAFQTNTQASFPVSTRKAPVPHYDVAVGLLRDAEGHLLIQRRPEDGLLGGLWEFPGGKQVPGESLEETCRREFAEELGVSIATGALVARVDHAYTHFRVTLHAFDCVLQSGTPVSRLGQPVRWVRPDALDQYAFPRANRRILERIRQAAQAPTLFG